MKYLKLFNENEKISYRIDWQLEDISGDCSPSGSTTLDSGNIEFTDIEEKDDIIDEIKADNYRADPMLTKLYMSFKVLDNDVIINEEDLDI